MALPQHVRSIHPFPARMAPELVWEELPDSLPRLRVLDPMAGSGTTLVTAKLRGHEAIGFDRDPLAVLIARAWLTNVDQEAIAAKASEVLLRARSRARDMMLADAYPRGADAETKAFVRFWFDDVNRKQLAALSDSISRLHDNSVRDMLWCALSRLIITKQCGVSRAMDVSHSRPHRTYDKAPLIAFEHFEQSVRRMIKASPFKSATPIIAPASVDFADARRLPIDDSSVDIVITSPPYLNAIDYIRGHKFSLVWMNHSIEELRNVRATNVGTEVGVKRDEQDTFADRVARIMCPIDDLTPCHNRMLAQYVRDMHAVLGETKRVLRNGGKAVFVVGNCNLQSTFIQNSKCIETIASDLGLSVQKTRSRPLPENRRYLPPPGSSTAGRELKKRMREEVIITMLKK
jgi:DNA modification methylase